MYKILPSWGHRRSSESGFLYLQLQTLFSCHMTSKVYFFNLLSRSNPGVAQAVKKHLLLHSSMSAACHPHGHIHTHFFPKQYNTQKKFWRTEYWHLCDILQLPLTVERTMYLLQTCWMKIKAKHFESFNPACKCSTSKRRKRFLLQASKLFTKKKARIKLSSKELVCQSWIPNSVTEEKGF